MFLLWKKFCPINSRQEEGRLEKAWIHKIPSCAFRARPGNSQTLFRWMSMATPLPYNIFDLSIFTAKATHSHPCTGPLAKRSPRSKSFWKGGARGGRTFFQKGFPLRKLFFLQISRRLPGVSQTKNPRRSGDKKRPPRAVSCKGVSNDLWQRPTFPHDVMQYHRRWRA